jgi:hypothetical protein
MEIQSRFSVSDPISFEQAIELTHALMAELLQDQVTEVELESILSALVRSENGARGFFVTYLTSELPIADRPSAAVLQGLRSSPTIVSELLVKNLAMSTAMMLTHTRNQNPELAAGSQRVQTRTTSLIQQTQIPELSVKLQQLHQSVETGVGEYQNFLDRWKYDDEQRNAIAQVISRVMT